MKFLDYVGLGHLIEEIKSKFVQKVSGKDLSSNDFTDAYKTKLSGVESGAQKNTVNSVNDKKGDVKLTSDDIEFQSSVVGATPTTTRAIIDEVLAKDKAQDTAIGKKADKSTTYTKEEVDSKLDDIDSGVTSVNSKSGEVVLNADDLSDVSTVNKFVTEEDKESWNNKASVQYVDNETGKKVDKVTGKGLSTNDFTDSLKSKLEGIEAEANKNVIDLIQRNGTNLEVIGKTVNIEVPTKLGDLTNDKTFLTKAQIQALIADQGRLKKEIVPTLPAAKDADSNTMYLIRNEQNTGYEEWLVINGAWEILGDTAAVDFTGYIHQDDITAISTNEIDMMLSVEG